MQSNYNIDILLTMLDYFISTGVALTNYFLLFLRSISPEVIAGVFIFIISERYRINQKNKERFREARIRFLVYVESFLNVIVSERVDEENKDRLSRISQSIREKYSEIESTVIVLNKNDRERWRKNFKIIRDDIKIFALINTIGVFSGPLSHIDRSEQIVRLREILGSD